ncbi:MAG TPA: hypothetical protein PLE75_09125 [Ferruginibacter sp.]|nr:hypothetical protein [Ferruginibacter sp.]HRO96231.1 hypothetical protein [Ferruginibacter sp.]
MKYVLITVCILTAGSTAIAQRDTTRKPSVEIISTYKPVLRNASKIQFSGTHLAQDTSRRVAPYQVPVQKLFYAYQPVPLNALALDMDTTPDLGKRYYVKAGFGNLSTPYLKAAGVFGNGETHVVNLYADHVSSKGPIEHQDFSKTAVQAKGTYFGEQFELNATAGVALDRYHLYGYDHTLYQPAKGDVEQYFQQFHLGAGIKNTRPGPYGIDYDPSIRVNHFSLAKQFTETSFIINAPVEKKFSDELLVKFTANADITRYNPDGNLGEAAFTNSVIRLSPAVKYFASGAFIHAGLSPVWYNKTGTILPDVYFEVNLNDRFVLQGGWIGRIHKNTAGNLAQMNPFIRGPFNGINTKETEFYGGIRTSVGSHFNIGAKVSWVQLSDALLFLNDTTAFTNNFITGTEERLNNLRIHGNVSYILQDKFTVNGSVTLNGFTGMKQYSRAWNMLPLEISGSVRYQALKKLQLKGDVYMFGGARSFDKNNGSFTMKGGTDLSFGASYAINKQFSVWMDVNNVLNDKYRRWNMYPVYGIQFLGGIIVHL